MTLHALRVRIGDEAFFRLLKQWVSENAGGTVTTKRFIALAERSRAGAGRLLQHLAVRAEEAGRRSRR